jgi:hypothetical protein
VRAYALHAKATLILAEALRDDGPPVDAVAVLGDAGFTVDAYMPDTGFDPATGRLIMLWPATLAENVGRQATRRDQRRVLAAMFGVSWLTQAGISPTLDWGDGPPQLSLDLGDHRLVGGDAARTFWPGDPLFSVLTVAITAQIRGESLIAQCARCGHLRPSSIKVRTDRPNYCPACQVVVRRARNAASARKRRARPATS